MLSVSELYIYPIKSLGGISLPTASLTDRGFEYDRRWMLVDNDNRFLSQREIPAMALLQVELDDQGLLIRHKTREQAPLLIPLQPQGESCIVEVWDDRCPANYVSQQVDQWFTTTLQTPCRLVYMPDTSRRHVDGRYAIDKEIVSFADGYPLLLIGQASLDDLNTRLTSPVPMNRFRPNIVFTGGTPFQEDDLKEFTIGDITFFGVKRCARCIITTIDQDTIARSKEPLRTLNEYRKMNNKIYFGQNLLFQGTGALSIGDLIKINQP
ncbi:MAG TPA: MOSC N-terminal beta barrel domain-containing protein [Puia sp.]|nr:MOSC N-terminal beta barrel domain-containing protein [Puia sp.]